MAYREFFSILRAPDRVMGATEKTDFRFEEDLQADCPVDYEYKIEEHCAKVIVRPSGAPIQFLKLRWRGDFSFVDGVCGDEWGLVGSEGAYSPISWQSVQPNRKLPWFVYVKEGSRVGCYGVKTGADCFAFWQVDTHGITLFLNLMAGSVGVDLQEELVACTVVERFPQQGDTPYTAAKEFAKQMCDNPVLPKGPVFGVNNWYWAYGNITHDIVLKETELLMEMTAGTKHKPYMMIDDGWQQNRGWVEPAYHGGPWNSGEHFGDVEKTAHAILEKGAKPGLWFRPLLTLGRIPWEAHYYMNGVGQFLDPTHPFTLERIHNDVSNFRNWGFELIKHDFTTHDIVGDNMTSLHYGTRLTARKEKFFDTTKTMATVIKNLYRTMQEAAGDGEVIACNTVGHLVAGIHSIHRGGYDTSGNSFQYTACNGSNAMMRLPQNDTFFKLDPDCASFTKNVPMEANLDFLKMCAVTGVVTMASVEPGIATPKFIEKMQEIYHIADRDELRCGIEHFEKTSSPEIFTHGENRFEFDWTKTYDGSRCQLG